jgi:hypothetical protein
MCDLCFLSSEEAADSLQKAKLDRSRSQEIDKAIKEEAKQYGLYSEKKLLLLGKQGKIVLFNRFFFPKLIISFFPRYKGCEDSGKSTFAKHIEWLHNSEKYNPVVRESDAKQWHF